MYMYTDGQRKRKQVITCTIEHEEIPVWLDMVKEIHVHM